MGSNEFLVLLLENPLAYGGSVAVAIALSWALSLCTRVAVTGGFLAYYGYLIVNVASALFLWSMGTMQDDRFAHFITTELFMYFIISFIYKHAAPSIVRHANSASSRTLRWISVITVLMLCLSALYTGLMITDESSSRIEFQLTSTAFSFVKPFSYFAFTAAAFLPFFQIRKGGSFGLTMLTLGSMAVFSIAAQSKGAFAVGLLSAYLLLREHGYFRHVTGRRKSGKKNIAIFFLTSSAFVVNLYVLQVDPLFMLARIAYSSDSVFMTYPYQAPDELCANVDWLSAYHRGVGRALQVPAASDPTTIFGVRLVQNIEVEDALRGPNARVSSYSLCNFGNFGTLPFLIYLSLLLVLQHKLVRSIGRRFPSAQLLMLPFFISTLVDGAQDVYKIMTGFTILVAVWLLGILIPRIRGRNANARSFALNRHPYQGSPT